MAHTPTRATATASPTPQTLSDAQRHIKENGLLTGEALRRVTSDLACAARMIGRSADELPCAPVLLRPILKAVLPARFGVKARRWGSIKSSITRMLKLTGWIDAEPATDTGPSSVWQPLWDRIAARRNPTYYALRKYMVFCDHAGIVPLEANDAALGVYVAWRTEHTLELNPKMVGSFIRRAWNDLVRTEEGWPRHILSTPVDPRQLALPLQAFPLALQSEFESYAKKLASGDPFDPVFAQPLAALTIKCRIDSLVRGASALVRLGRAVEAITSVADIIRPDAFEAIMLEHYNRLGQKKWAPSSNVLAHHLYRTAVQIGNQTPEELTRLKGLVKMVRKQHPTGLQRKARDRIAQFDDPTVIAAYFRLPTELFAAADRELADGRAKTAAVLHQQALALELLNHLLLRMRNLSKLEEQHFIRDRKTRGRIVKLLIRDHETKNGVEIQADIDPALADRIDRHIQIYRPIITDRAVPWLFCGPSGNCLSIRRLGQGIKDLVTRHVGIEFHPHLMRHLMATMMLDHDPGNMPVVQQGLGHARLQATERMYGVRRTRAGLKLWRQTLENTRGPLHK